MPQDVQVTSEGLESAVRVALSEVADPEIPTLSVIDLGMVSDIQCTSGGVSVKMTPTFVGCPALAIIRNNVERRLGEVPGVTKVAVDFVFDSTWTTERITEAGRQRLKEFGIAPPTCSLRQMKALTSTCPYCNSEHTRLENLFGPTACRSVFYCLDCKQPFEAMKPV